MEYATHPLVPGEGGSRTLAALPNGNVYPQVMQYAYREMLTPRMLRQVLAALGTIVAVFTVIGPISTYETLSPLRRLGYWSLCYFVAWPMCFCMSVVTLYLLRHRSPRAASLSLAGMTLVAAVPATGIVCSIEQLLRPAYMVGLPTLYARVVAVMLPATVLVHVIALQRAKLNGTRPSAGEQNADRDAGSDGHQVPADSNRGYPRAIAANAGTIGTPAPASAGQRVAESVPQPLSQRATTPATKPRSVFDRLPGRLGSDLIYLTVDDHYVKAHTPAGSAIILMRFADAVAELSDHGLQVHRSYWVASSYLKRLVQREGRTVLHLTTGQEIPVSRTYLAATRAALRDLEANRPVRPPRESLRPVGVG